MTAENDEDSDCEYNHTVDSSTQTDKNELKVQSFIGCHML